MEQEELDIYSVLCELGKVLAEKNFKFNIQVEGSIYIEFNPKNGQSHDDISISENKIVYGFTQEKPEVITELGNPKSFEIVLEFMLNKAVVNWCETRPPALEKRSPPYGY